MGARCLVKSDGPCRNRIINELDVVVNPGPIIYHDACHLCKEERD